MYFEYESLSAKEKECYRQIAKKVKEASNVFTFYGITKNTISKAFNAFLYDNPLAFWFSGAGKYNWTESNGIVKDITFVAEFEKGINAHNLRDTVSRFNRTVNSVVQKAKEKRTVYEQVLFVHNYIVDTTEYVQNAPQCHSAYGCLVNHRAVCSGYAKAFMIIMRKLGYDCGYATGSDVDKNSIHSSHAWNYIKLGNDFYFIDVTWDDPTVEGAVTRFDNKSMDYFCITTDELLLTHKLSKDHYVPYCGGTKYDYYRYNGYFINSYSYASFVAIAQKQLRLNSKKIDVKFSSASELNRAKHDLLDNNRIFNLVSSGNVTYLTGRNGLVLTIYVI